MPPGAHQVMMQFRSAVGVLGVRKPCETNAIAFRQRVALLLMPIFVYIK